MSTLTNGQLLALEHFIDHHGRRWRGNLAWAWCSAAPTQGVTKDEAACLQQLRNLYGPSWLNKYRPGDTSVGWLMRGRLEVPVGTSYRWVDGWRIAHEDGKDMIQPYVRNKTEARQLARSLNITLMEDGR